MTIDQTQLNQTIKNLEEALLSQCNKQGHWEGRLSSSALSTATAVFALARVDASKHRMLIECGLAWLTQHQNKDGGWGDTIHSQSNVSTTLLCYSALTVAESGQTFQDTTARAQSWIQHKVGSLEPTDLARAVDRAYGKDKTFSVPILTMCALAGCLGHEAWQYVRPLPFELAVLPRRLFKWLRLPVVSYALPALIALGQVGFHYRRCRCPVKRVIRSCARKRTLKILQRLQPANGGFLEAAPLTAFVCMSLASCGHKDHPVVRHAVQFLCASARDDGSWPIDTNLATWVTTLAVHALHPGDTPLNQTQRDALHAWLLRTQHRRIHPFTLADPGAWAWTDLPGAVPDADDTAGALVGLYDLHVSDTSTLDAAQKAIRWLVGLQNSDGGMPTFCRGWTRLPFDRSCPDITAHALAAFACWQDRLSPELQEQIHRALQSAIQYLQAAQLDNGSWVPLWFGNEHTPDQTNPVYGTARVMSHLAHLSQDRLAIPTRMITRAVDWLISVQHQDGAWGGDAGTPPSIEETALAVHALSTWLGRQDIPLNKDKINSVISRGAAWLIEHTHQGQSLTPAPIGLYFARLWYSEDLYPHIFTLAALERVRRIINDINRM